MLKHHRHCFLPLYTCLCLTHTHTRIHTTTLGTLQEMWNICLVAEHSFCRVANERTGLWRGLGSMALLLCLTCYNQPSLFLLFLFNPPEHDPYPVCGVFLERLCHSLTIIHGSDMVRADMTWGITGLDVSVEDLHTFRKWGKINPRLNDCFWFCSRCGLLVFFRHRAHKEREGRNGPLPLLVQGHHWYLWTGSPQQQEGG